MRFNLLLLAVLAAGGLAAQNATTPGSITQEPPTCRCLGFQWAISGDADRDCEVTVEYRESGQSTWQNAHPMLRVEDVNGVSVPNMLAGSILNLSPGTNYEVRLTLNDPDGGSSTQTINTATRAVPADTTGTVLYAEPGSGGGTGTQSNPYKGLAAAQSGASAGDTVILKAGTYSGQFNVTKSGSAGNPIIYKGEDQATVILDGGSSDQAVYFSGAKHVQLENCTVEAGSKRGIRGVSGCEDIVLRKLVVDCTAIPRSSEAQGILFIGSSHKNVFVSECELIGHELWTQSRTDSYGISLTGKGHIVRYCEIYDWWDGIALGSNATTIETSACDVYGCEIHRCTDDAIEADSVRHNIRIFENRFTNIHVVISHQPLLGGPSYVVRNACYNVMLKALKLHLNGGLPNTRPTGLVCVNNTFVNADRRGLDGDMDNAYFRNNLFMGSTTVVSGQHIAMEFNTSSTTMDYNGWRANGSNFAGYNGNVYSSIGAFRSATGHETHGKVLDLNVFESVTEPNTGGQSYPWPSGFPAAVQIGSQDLTPASGGAAIDAGVLVDNLSGSYNGSAPDLGAYERGTTPPGYGPGAAGNGGSGGGSGGSALAITTSSLPDAFLNTSYVQTISSTNGTGPYTWTLAGGALPPGLNLDTGSVLASTTLSGVPTTEGSWSFTVQVTDATGASDLKMYTVGVSLQSASAGASSGGGGCSLDGSTAPWWLLALILAPFMLRRRRS